MMTKEPIRVNTDTTKFEVDGRCMDCQFQTFDRLLKKVGATYHQRQEFFGHYNVVIAKSAMLTMAQIHRILHIEFCKITGVSSPYSSEKNESNKHALSLYKQLRIRVLDSSNPYNMALRISIAGNIMDYGISGEFQVQSTIDRVLGSEFAVDDSIELHRQIKSASKILFLGDNAGEIVFDKLFIETLIHPHLTYAVRGSDVLNDATLEDAQQVNMDLVADVISNGYNAPSTVLSECSEEFLRVYNEADLIISKGQGNFEGLITENDPRIFYLLMVKCDVIAELLNVKKGDFVVTNPLL